jgi:hypothetical protein
MEIMVDVDFVDTTDWTEAEWLIAGEAVQRERVLREAHRKYQKRMNRPACCDREAIGDNCVCWQDRW